MAFKAFRKSLRSFVREHRRATPVRLLATASEKYLRLYHNEDYYEFDRNGESFAMATLGTWLAGRPCVAWDVGAHKGSYAATLLERIPNCTVVAFEITPQIYSLLAAEFADEPRVTTVNKGLSSAGGTVEITFNPKFSTTNAIAPRSGSWIYEDTELEITECAVTTGDAMLAAVAPPDFLKIDTEGHEVSVFEGCRGLLAGPTPPAMIQFEYGATYLPSGSTLKKVYDLLTPAGYRMGRLFPNHVGFADYRWEADDFRMGNFIAARDPALIQALAG